MRTIQRLLDGATHDELMSHDAHRLAKRGAQDGLAQAAGDPGNEAARIMHVVIRWTDDAAGEHETPGRRVDEQGFRLTEMRGPIATGDLVRDELVRRRIVGNTQ